jgi:hypothetical protein
MTTFDPTDHQKLRDTFSTGDVVGANLLPIHLLEEQREVQLCTSFSGYRLLNQCFLAFLYETLHIANKEAPESKPELSWYRPLLLVLATLFSRARASEIVYLHGYALEGFALLRDIKDRAILLAGILHGITTLPLILGFTAEGKLENDRDYWAADREMVKRRKSAHQATFKSMLTEGLPAEVADHLRRWGDLFNAEVHMSLHSFVHEGLRPYRATGELNIGPNQSQLALEMYMNRSLEVSWALLKVLPIVQYRSFSHGDEWCRKWHLLDYNLKIAVESVADQATDIVPSLLQWFQIKLPFNPSWSYLGRSEPAA